MYCIYCIYNPRAKKIYIGQTMNIAIRLIEHNNHTYSGFTSRFPGEWALIYQESVATRPEALKREKQLKSFQGREFLKKHIPG